MKKRCSLVAILILFCICNTSNAQTVFWTENFGTTCYPRGNLATSYSGINGAWTVSSTGTNAAYANKFFINDRVSFNGVGNCATGSNSACSSNNNSLHIGSADATIFTLHLADDEGSYLTGAYCSGFSICSTTNKRAESPVIDCTGKSSITLSFVYVEGGDAPGGTNGDASLWYFDGTSWSMLDPLAKTAKNCGGFSIFGKFTSFSISLPASANNNPNVKIGFAWSNDDSAVGSDPSLAVDDITLSVPAVALPPVSNLSTGVTTFCANTCINFSDLSTNTPTSWLWTFNGATPSSSTLKNPTSICYSTANTYDVKLVVSNGAGIDSITMSNYITVNAPPTPGASNSSPLCSGGTLNLTSGGGTGYSWSGPNGFTSVQQNPNISNIPVANTGTYTVTVTGANTCTATTTTAVAVNLTPTAGASSNSPQCLGNTVALSSSGGTGYSWSGPNSFSSLQQNPNISNVALADSGIYTVTVTAANGCTATQSTSVNITQAPTPGASSNSPVCTGSTLSLSSGGGAGYSWSGPNSFTSAQQNPNATNIAMADAGTYTVTVTGAGGCTATTTTIVTVNQSPTSASASNDGPLCSGNTLNLSSDGGAGYSWAGPNSFSSLQQNPGISNAPVANAGTYTVTVTAANSCTATATTAATVNPPPLASSSSNSPLCFGATLNLSSDGGTGYSWTGPGGFNSLEQEPVTLVALSADSGTYTVTVTDANTCTATSSVSVVVYPPVPAPIVTPNGNTLSCSTSPTYTSYQWSDNTGPLKNGPDTFLVINHSGDYSVEVTNENGCKTAVGVTAVFTDIPTLSGLGDEFFYLTPNPATNRLVVHSSFSDTRSVTMRVMNVLGEMMREEKIMSRPQSSQNERTYSINIEDFPAGIYFLQLKSENLNMVKRFVKE